MKIIELFNKIANNEEVPKEIMFRGELCSFDEEDKDYYCQEYGYIVWHWIDNGTAMNEVLDTELDIIEEKTKKIEKLEEFDIQGLEVSGYSMTQAEYLLEEGIQDNRNKINEIIDYLLEKESDK